MKIEIAEKKKVDKLVEECTETVEEVKIAKISLSEDKNKQNVVHAHCTLCCFQYLLQFSILRWYCHLFCLFSLVLKKRCSTCYVWHS